MKLSLCGGRSDTSGVPRSGNDPSFKLYNAYHEIREWIFIWCHSPVFAINLDTRGISFDELFMGPLARRCKYTAYGVGSSSISVNVNVIDISRLFFRQDLSTGDQHICSK